MKKDVCYDPQNLFARMLRHEVPFTKVHEDDATLSIMDAMPQSKGHVLVLTKEPARTLLDLSTEQACALMATTHRLARVIVRSLCADGFSLYQYNEREGGQTVFHVHMHIVPRYVGVPLNLHARTFEDPALLEGYAERIREALKE